MQRKTGVVAVVLGGVAATAVTLALGSRHWHRATVESVARMHRAESGALPAYSRESLTGLPEPVVRYFEFALLPGQSQVRRARFQQRGELRSGAEAAWSGFTAVEYFSVQRPGFVWDARIEMAPVPLRVRDSYVAGDGASLARLAGLVTVDEQPPSPRLSSASLARYLAEAAWLPTALLPSAHLGWTALGERSARVTLRDGEESASVDVEFGDGGEIARISTLRYRKVGSALVLTPWAGRFRDYSRRAGMMVPAEAEVEWFPPESAVAVWRGRIERAEYEFA